ncbi:hypothetical protein L1887_48905 [Cichorium endivia]|nr:hypothetical protein L1887_48905 [Cichorium endivia]
MKLVALGCSLKCASTASTTALVSALSLALSPASSFLRMAEKRSLSAALRTTLMSSCARCVPNALSAASLAAASADRVDLAQARLGLVRHAAHARSLVARHGNDATDALGDARLLGNDKVADLARLGHVRAAAELDRGRAPPRVLEVAGDGVEVVLERDDADGVGIGLAKHGAQAGDLLGRVELHLLGEDADVALDPVDRDVLDLLELLHVDALLVRKVESELGGRDERALLVNVVAEHLAQAKVEDVGGGVVRLERSAAALVVRDGDLVAQRELATHEMANVQHVAREDLRILYDELRLAVDGDGAGVGLLATALGLLGLGLGGLELLFVDAEAVLFGHDEREVDGEAKGVVELPYVCAAELLAAGSFGLGGVLFEELLAAVEGACEGGLLLVEDGLDVVDLLGDLGEEVAHLVYEGGYELGEEGSDGDLEVLAHVAGAATEDATEDVAAAVAVGDAAVGDGKGEGADVVRDDAVGGVDAVGVLCAELAGVGARAGELLDLGKDGGEDVGVVVGGLVLEDGDEALEAHAGVDVLCGEGPQGAVVLAVELHKDVVPDLDDVGVVHVDEVCGVAAADPVVVDLGAGAAGAGGAHLPEVVLCVAGEDVVGVDADLEPEVARLGVGFEALLCVALKVGDVEAVLGEAVDLGEELPCHGDGLGLEVVAEGPVSEHLEEGVVVGVLADVVEVVVLSACTDALLGVDGALHGAEGGVGVCDAEEDGLVLVHACVGEEERGVIVGDGGGGGHKGVLALLEVCGEGVAHLGGGPVAEARGGVGHGGEFRRGARLRCWNARVVAPLPEEKRRASCRSARRIVVVMVVMVVVVVVGLQRSVQARTAKEALQPCEPLCILFLPSSAWNGMGEIGASEARALVAHE